MSGFPETGNVSIQVFSRAAPDAPIRRFEELVLDSPEGTIQIQEALLNLRCWWLIEIMLSGYKSIDEPLMSLEAKVYVNEPAMEAAADQDSVAVRALKDRFSSEIAPASPWVFSPEKEFSALDVGKADCRVLRIDRLSESVTVADVQTPLGLFRASEDGGYIRLAWIRESPQDEV